MCNIGEPLEILNIEPLGLPAPLRRETEPVEQGAAVPASVPDTTVVPETFLEKL